MIDILLTAQDFLEHRFEYPDDGRWSELYHGQLFHQPPVDERYGQLVLKLSKYLAAYFQKHRTGYASFHTGLLVTQRPDTILFPAISIFLGGKLFAETDLDLADRVPEIVFDLIATPSKKSYVNSRKEVLVAHGVQQIIYFDLLNDQTTIHQPNVPDQILESSEILQLGSLLPGLQIPLTEIFTLDEF